ncbi:MAG: cbb3-type cytochrome c oxidase subunit I [Rhodospirillales bacterium]|nr:cbb3-type cytochrome c oxidase subunit I [Rhodospirillales bacterium]
MSSDSPSPEAGFLAHLGPVRNPAMNTELRAWAGLAMLSLAMAGVFALLLAVSRIPGIQNILPLPLDFFERGLVIHVVFSFVVWFQAVFGCLLNVSTGRLADGAPRMQGLGKLALAGAYASCVLLFVPAFMERGEATLNNYIPAITDPLFYAGLALLAAAIGLMVLRLLINVIGSAGRWKEPLPFGTVCTALIFGVALLCFAITGATLVEEELSYEFNESLFWGGGHVLQFANTAMLLTALFVLARLTLKDVILKDNQLILTALSMLVLYGGMGISVTLKYAPVHEKYWAMFTQFQYALTLPALLVGIPMLVDILQQRRLGQGLPMRNPAFLCLLLSPVVFAVGGVLGLFVDGGDTRTPAHYHGIIAGINLSFMGLFYGFFLPLLDREVARGKALYAQIFMFGGGQLLASIGLFLAGGYGTPRKTAGGAQGLETIGAKIGMYMNGIGALIAVIGGVMFIWMVSKALLKAPNITTPQS